MKFLKFMKKNCPMAALASNFMTPMPFMVIRVGLMAASSGSGCLVPMERVGSASTPSATLLVSSALRPAVCNLEVDATDSAFAGRIVPKPSRLPLSNRV